MTQTSVELDDLSKLGAIVDEPPYELPPEAWSLSLNMRDYANGIEKLKGQTQTLGTGTLGSSPDFLQYVSAPAQPFWLWTSNVSAFAWDGTTHTDITRAAGAYTATSFKQWNGTIFGGIPILNNGIDLPQFWSAYDVTQKLQNLTNFPAATRCKVMRSFLAFLVALNTTDGAGAHPHRILWSTEADPGSLPSTWDINDATKDAGDVDLSDTISGQILDGLELNGQFFIYKENAVWRQFFIGGNDIFSFKSFLTTAGLLATRCVALTGDGTKQVFVSQDDILVHNGQSADSILTNRYRRYLFNLLDVTNFDTSFLFSNPLYSEMWFCFPTSGSSAPNHALIWNYKDNTIREADSGVVNFVATDIGSVPTTSGTTWTAQTLRWNEDTMAWATSLRRRVVTAKQSPAKFLLLDQGTTNDGSTFNGILQRTGLSIVGRKRTGEWVVDIQKIKQMTRLWPKVVNGPINVRVGYQDFPNSMVRWSNVVSFDPSIQSTVDGIMGTGRAVAVEFSSTNDWRIDGYKIDLNLRGKF